jgi:hypothetical protein
MNPTLLWISGMMWNSGRWCPSLWRLSHPTTTLEEDVGDLNPSILLFLLYLTYLDKNQIDRVKVNVKT